MCLSVKDIADVYCQFTFLDDMQREFVSTPTCPYQTSRPAFEFSRLFRPKVTEELCDYFRESRLEIKVGAAAVAPTKQSRRCQA